MEATPLQHARVRDIEGMVAVVTGGAGGIGLAMGRHFAEHGMKVMLADIQSGPLDEAIAKLHADGLTVAGCVTDVTKLESVERLAVETQRIFGAAHVLCNNAGIGPGGQTMLWDYEENDWRWCFDVNVLGIAWGIKAFVPVMLAQGTEGHIVNTSSGNGGIAPMGDAPIYATSKAAVTTLTELLYYQLKTQTEHLSCSVLFPGPNWLRTHLWEAWKTRPDEYAKSVPRSSPYPTFEEFEAQMEAAGTPLPITPLDEVASRVLDAIRNDVFWINPSGDDPLDARHASMKARRNPDYFRNWNPTTGE
jgi:NAD(P)-dependent dehydrogenase (short-subunit alcohol dehydrogenase family)